MAKAPVLGNDPFLRGAAPRPAEPAPVAEAPKPAPEHKPEPKLAAPKKPRVVRPRPAKKSTARKAPARRVLEGELVDAIPRLPAAEMPPAPPASPPTWLEQAQQAASGLAGKAVQALLASSLAQRTLEQVMGSPVTHTLASAAARAASATRPALDVALRLLPPAASATRSAVSAVVSGEAAKSIVATAAEAGAALRQAAARSEPTGDVDAFGEDPSVLSRAEPLLDFLHDRYFRVEALAPERLPKGACLLVCNHSGVLPLDGPMIRTVLRRECHRPDARWLVEDAIFHAPIVGTLLNRLGAVRACPENAERILAQGVPLAVFPEGILGISKTVGRRYQLQRFGRGGFVKLALRTRLPIVPVAIVGAEEASPLLAKIPLKALGLPYLPLTPLVPLPAKWTVSFLEPITLRKHPAKDADDPALVTRLTAEVRDAIQRELDRLLQRRRSILAG